MIRGVGTTTKQMKAAPKDSIFIWCSANLDYPKRLARHIGREDIKIVGPQWLLGSGMYGREFTGVIVDHAARLTDKQWDLVLIARTRIII